jgi:hypothetical protein
MGRKWSRVAQVTLGLVALTGVGAAWRGIRRRRAVARADAPLRLPCRGSGGGTVPLSRRASASFVIEMEGDESGVWGRLEGAVVARGRPGWVGRAQRRPLPEPPPLREGPRRSGGGTLGGIWAIVDVSDRVAWVGSERVPLPEGHNVVLLDRADGVGEPPTVVRTLGVEPAFALPGPDCGVRNARSARARTDAIKAVLLRSPEVRKFIEG